MRVSDFIAAYLRQLGCTNVFLVTGGAAMHLNDSFSEYFSPNIHPMHHEQSCSMAAEAFARISGKPAVVNVTAGPGGINALNGVFGAYVDSIPMIVISGQAKVETLVRTYDIPSLRQLGDQEVNIESISSSLTKYSTTIIDPLTIGDELYVAFTLATSGRQGPVWLDIPIDIQAYKLPIQYTDAYLSPQGTASNALPQPTKITAQRDDIKQLAYQLLHLDRPVLYVGSGIRLSDSVSDLYDFLDQWPIPTVTGWNSNDLLPDTHSCYAGRPGTVGNRAGNFAVQYSGCLVTLGCRLNIRQVSYNWESFARNAWRCQVDVDISELIKPTLDTHLRIHSDLNGFLPSLSAELHTLFSALQPEQRQCIRTHWMQWMSYSKSNLERYSSTSGLTPSQVGSVNPYRLIDTFSRRLTSGSITVCADGTACVVGFQAFRIKQDQRLFHNSGCASMGYELPAAIGAYYAARREIYCLAGDGSIMMNLQELAIIGGHLLPIKIILLNNSGYHSIRQTQRNYFPGNQVGCGPSSGLPFPSFKKIAESFGIPHLYLDCENNLPTMIDVFLAYTGPVFLEVMIDLKQDFAPKLASRRNPDGTMCSSALEDMSPLLTSEELSRTLSDAVSLVNNV